MLKMQHTLTVKQSLWQFGMPLEEYKAALGRLCPVTGRTWHERPPCPPGEFESEPCPCGYEFVYNPPKGQPSRQHTYEDQLQILKDRHRASLKSGGITLGEWNAGR